MHRMGSGRSGWLIRAENRASPRTVREHPLPLSAPTAESLAIKFGEVSC